MVGISNHAHNYGITICVWYNISHRTCMVHTIYTPMVCTACVCYVPYAYGTIYACGIEQLHL